MLKSAIYIIKNTLNNKIYIGSTKDINTRWKQHNKKLMGN